MYLPAIKPLLDRTGALVALLLTLPISLLALTVLAFANKGKIFFVQQRIGYHEKHFKIYKFKTLRDTRDENGNLLPDQQRTFPAGLFIRRFHIDELPQLFNILAGDLSFIGPRPLLPEYLPYYTLAQRQRHYVKPGLTGLSQALGGNALNWDVRLRLDSLYARQACAAMDWKILVKTIKNFFSGKTKRSSAIFSEHFVEYVKRNTSSRQP
jgi:undecaprenyl phosphate N,N'-diacetylbacillosamine 1-phosphate transferase